MAELRPHYIDVDLKKNTQYNVPVVTQNDTATHFIIRVTDDGLSDPELLDAYQEITMTSQRPDGESFYLTGTRIPGTNEIEFHLGTDETAFHGSVLASLQFYLVEDASRYTSAQFRYDVKKDLTTNYTPTQREETLVEVVLKEGPGVIQEAKDAKVAVDGALVELEQDKTAAIERLDEVTEENKTVFRQPVNTFADLATTYPNPEHGTTVRVTGESATYRYSDGSWVKTDEYNPTAIDQVTAQLAETVKLTDTGVLDLNVFDEPTRAAIQGIEPGTINAVLGVGNVKPENTSFYKRGKNLFDKSKVVLDKYINSANGELANGSSYNATDFIGVNPNTTYRVTLLYHGAFYDINKVYIARIGGSTFTTPANAYYVRLSVAKTDMDTYQVELGTALTVYEPYKMTIDPDSIPPLLDKSVSREKTDFISVGKNKFDPATVTPGVYVNSSNGSLASNANYVASDFIEVESGVEYIDNAGYYLAYYDADKIYISGLGISHVQPFMTPANAKYIRVTVPKDMISSYQLEKGSSRTEYQQFGYIINRGLYQPITPSSNFAVEANIAPTIPALVGKEINIYFDNIMNDKVARYDIDVTCTIGKQQNERWTCIPAAAGTFPITIGIYKETALISSVVANVVVKALTVGDAVNKKAMIIGDSTTANGIAVAELNNLFTADVMDITLIGTQGTVPNVHEGRSGWTVNQYYTNAASPFVFSGVFDFAQYMSVNSLSVPDYVVINLGINDTFNYSDDASLSANITTILTQYQAMIDKIKAYNANIKIGIAVTIPPNYSQDAFGEDYANGQTRWRYKRNNFLWTKALIGQFKNKEANGIYLIPINVNLDTVNNMGTVEEPVNSRNNTTVVRSRKNSGVHPVSSGYYQIADVYYYWIKSFEN